MKFYFREKELKLLKLMYEASPSFIVLTGRRRVGKTELIKEHLKDKRSIYLFVDHNRSSELLIRDFESAIRKQLGLKEYVRFERFEDIFEYLMDLDERIVVAIDEFQRFQKVDPAVITGLQKIWDLKGVESKIQLIISGSSMGMIRKIFIDQGAPLFKRADNIITLGPFDPGEIFRILEDIGIEKREDKMNLFLLFGGTIYYYRLMEKFRIRSFEEAVDLLILDDLAPLRNEVREILIEEFGREHATYYEILSALASGKCTKKEMGDMTHISSTSLAPYLYDLIDILQLVEYRIPITEKAGKTKKGRYFLKEPFFIFYFNFIYRNMIHYTIGNLDSIRGDIRRDWRTHSGRIFETVVHDLLARKIATEYPRVGRYWDRKGNEFDFVGLDLKRKRGIILEVKRGTLSSEKARSLLERLVDRSTAFPVKGIRFEYGIVAEDIEGAGELRKDGFLTYDLDEMIP